MFLIVSIQQKTAFQIQTKKTVQQIRPKDVVLNAILYRYNIEDK